MAGRITITSLAPMMPSGAVHSIIPGHRANGPGLWRPDDRLRAGEPGIQQLDSGFSIICLRPMIPPRNDHAWGFAGRGMKKRSAMDGWVWRTGSAVIAISLYTLPAGAVGASGMVQFAQTTAGQDSTTPTARAALPKPD